MRVLIVDDIATARYSLRALVESLHHEVAGEAVDGVEALEQIATAHPDVVVMDFMMPRLDGVSATATISRLHPAVQVIAYTSVVYEDTRELFLRAGALELVGKGDVPGLVAALERAALGAGRRSA